MCCLPSRSCINAVIIVNQHMAHTYHVLPLYFRMLYLYFFGKIIGSFTDNLNILYSSVKQYLVLAKVFKCFPFKKLLDIANSLTVLNP